MNKIRNTRPRCRRDGCERTPRSASHACCDFWCENFDRELTRLQDLYETAAEGIGPGEPGLAPDAWTALVEVSDAWTNFRSARAALFKETRLRDLPVPTDPPSSGVPASHRLTVVRLIPMGESVP